MNQCYALIIDIDTPVHHHPIIQVFRTEAERDACKNSISHDGLRIGQTVIGRENLRFSYALRETSEP